MGLYYNIVSAILLQDFSNKQRTVGILTGRMNCLNSLKKRNLFTQLKETIPPLLFEDYQTS